MFVYYESIKRELKIRGIYECRCDERLQTKTKRFTRLPYTGLVLELEHLKILQVPKAPGQAFLFLFFGRDAEVRNGRDSRRCGANGRGRSESWCIFIWRWDGRICAAESQAVAYLYYHFDIIMAYQYA
jgi:hypothetical protein